jgi:outer membrane protein
MNNAFLISLICLLWSLPLAAQEQWSLERCIKYAMDNSISVKQSALNVANSELTDAQNKSDRLPNLNASGSYGLNLGRSINPYTNAFETRTSQYNSLGLNSGVTVYNGGRIRNSILQGQHDLSAARYDLQQTTENIALLVAQAYLSILLSEEQLGNAQRQLDDSNAQLQRTEKLIAAGSLPAANRSDLLSQVALDEQRVVEAQNSLDANYLNLKQLLQIDTDVPFEIERPQIALPTNEGAGVSMSSVFATARNRQPSILAGEERVKSAEIGVDIARAAKLPTVSFGLGLSTNYSDVARNANLVSAETTYNPISIIRQDGSTELIQFPSYSTVFSYSKIPYFEQIWNNLGGGVQLNVNVPIFDRNNAKIATQRARLNATNAALSLRQAEQDLRTDVQRAVADVRAADKQLAASIKTQAAAKMAFQNAEKRYQLGAGSFFDYSIAKNSLANAESSVLVARYDYIFKLKILDFYQGKPLRL